MGRLVVFLLLIAAGYLLINRLDPSTPGLSEDGGQLVVETAQLEARFSRIGSLSDSFMVFGGNNQQMTNSLTHVTLSGLPIRHARLIGQTYPDFHLCKSPGAAQAQRLTESTSFIGANRGARRTLIEAIDVHGERVRSGGDRTCVTISGHQLTLDSVHLKHDGRDITRDVAPTFGGTRFAVAEEVELADCASLLR
jgi:hypothetical protein